MIINNAKMKQELKEIEDNILSRLSNTEGNPVDDVDLIIALQASKAKSQEIQVLTYIQYESKKHQHMYVHSWVNTCTLYMCICRCTYMYMYSTLCVGK